MINKQYNINKKDIDFKKILGLAQPSKYPKICDFCGEVFEADICNKFSKYDGIKCPICFSLYYVVYNELNGFSYLEFAKSPDDHFAKIAPPNPRNNADFIFRR